jgi:hypothetical protein
MPFIQATDPYHQPSQIGWWEDLGLGTDEFAEDDDNAA